MAKARGITAEFGKEKNQKKIRCGGVRGLLPLLETIESTLPQGNPLGFPQGKDAFNRLQFTST